jgi:hypothetical protein
LGREQFVQTLGWGFPVERLAWAAVEFGGDRVEVVAGVHGQVGALGEVLPQQAVGVLVGAALPRAGRVAEMDRDVRGEGELVAASHLDALVPGQGLFHVGRQGLHGLRQGVADQLGATAVWEVDEQDVAGAVLDQGADGGSVVLCAGQAALI